MCFYYYFFPKLGQVQLCGYISMSICSALGTQITRDSRHQRIKLCILSRAFITFKFHRCPASGACSVGLPVSLEFPARQLSSYADSTYVFLGAQIWAPSRPTSLLLVLFLVVPFSALIYIFFCPKGLII